MEKLKKKHTVIFISLLIITILVLALTLTAALIPDLGDYQALIVVSIAIPGAGIILYLKKTFDEITVNLEHMKLFSNLAPAVKTNLPILSSQWLNDLVTKGYTKYKSLGSLVILYRFERGSQKSSKNLTLEILVLILDHLISYEDVQIVKYINDMEDELRKTHKYRHRIILQFKSQDKFSQDLAQSTHHVSWFRYKAQHIVVINIYHFSKDNVAYFVHNTMYYPTIHFKHGVELAFKLIT